MERPPIRAGMERLFDEIRQLLGNMFAPMRALRMVGVEAAAAVGHDDDERQPRDIAFDARAAHPDGVVVGEAMEEIEDGIRSFDIRVRQKDPCVDSFAEDVAEPVQIAE